MNKYVILYVSLVTSNERLELNKILVILEWYSRVLIATLVFLFI